MKKIVEKIISCLKQEEYHLDEGLSLSSLCGILFERGMMAVRGCFYKCRLKKSKGIFFVGRRVTIKAGKKLSVGHSVTLNDNCYINALCRGGVSIGNNFTLGRGSMIECTGVVSELGEKLIIGDNVGISPNAFISVRGNVSIGDNTIIGPNLTVISENHIFADCNQKICDQGVTRQGVIIGKNCWLGANVTILDGACIGDNSIVAAGAVVNKNVNPYEIVGGIPAKLIRSRCS